jgi:hypothetical protein
MGERIADGYAEVEKCTKLTRMKFASFSGIKTKEKKLLLTSKKR